MSTSAGGSPIVESPITEPTIEKPVEDDWNSEVEVSETDWGLDDDENDVTSATSNEMPKIVGSISDEEDENDEVIECESDSDVDIRDAEDVVTRFPDGDEFSEGAPELNPDAQVMEDIVSLLEKFMSAQQLASKLWKASPTGSSE